MKKRRGIARAVEPLPPAELEKLPTRALMARLMHLRWCEDSADRSDLSDDEIHSLHGNIIFKNTTLWRDAYNDVKKILDKREHISK